MDNDVEAGVPQSRSHGNSKMVFGLVVVILLLGTLGWYFWSKQEKPSQSSQLTTTQSSTSTVFTSTAYQYAIQVPPAWIASDGSASSPNDPRASNPAISDRVVFGSPCAGEDECGMVLNIDADITSDQFVDGNSKLAGKSLEEIARATMIDSGSFTDTVIANIPAVQFDSSNEQERSYFIQHNGKVFEIHWHLQSLGDYAANNEYITDSDPVRRQRVAAQLADIVSTFKFLD